MIRTLAVLGILAAAAAAETSYQIEVTLDAEAKVFQGVAKIAFTNDGTDPIDVVPLRLDLNRTGKDDGWMQIGEVTDPQGTTLELEYLKDREGKDIGDFPCAKLAAPLAPGEGTTLEVHYAGGVSADTPTFWMDDSDRGTTGAIFPRLVARSGKEWLRDEWTPASFLVTLVAPEAYRYATSGRLVGTENREEGMVATTYVSKGARGFALVADPGLQETSSDVGGVQIRVAAFGEVADADRIVREAMEALVALGTDLGDYPHAALVFLVSDRTLDLTSSHGFCVLPRSRLAGEELLTTAVAFAVARGWWGDAVSDPGAFPRWITSGFALHAIEPYVSKRFPETSFRDAWLSTYTEAANEGVDTTIAQPVRSFWSSGFAWDRVISMAKGYAILRLLGKRFPSPSLAERAKRLLTGKRGGVIAVEDLVAQCPEDQRADAKEFLRAWTMTDCEVNYAVAGAEGADGKTRVRIARLGNATSPVEVEGTTPEGKRARATWNGQDERGEVVLDLPLEGIHVRIDPERWVPDIDPADNDWFARPEKPVDLGKVSFRRAGKGVLSGVEDRYRWVDRFTIEVGPASPVDVGVEIEVSDDDGVTARRVAIFRHAAAGNALEGDFDLAGPYGTQKLRVRAFAASSEAEVAWAAKKEKPCWETQEDFDAAVELGGAKIGPVVWHLARGGAGIEVPVTLAGTGKGRVGLECRISTPGHPDRFRFGNGFDVERGKESTLELSGGSVDQRFRAEVELRIGLLMEGEQRLRPGAAFWTKRKVFGGK